MAEPSPGQPESVEGREDRSGDGEHGDISRPRALAAFEHQNFRFYLSGFLCSSASLQMMHTAIAWEIYERTRDPLALGIAGLVRALPVVMLAMFAGQLADTFNRKRIIILTQLGFSASAALLAWASWRESPLALLYGVLFLTGCVRAFNGPSRSSFLPLLVPDRTFQNAVTWMANGFQFSAIVGPLLAGGLLWATNAAWPVYLASAAGTGFMAAAVAFTRPAPQSFGRRQGALTGFFEGARHIWRERTVFGAIVLDLFAVLLGGATALLPVYAEDVLHAGPVGLGVLRAAPYAGALGMGLFMAHRPPFRRAGASLLWSVAAFGVATILFGLSTDIRFAVIFLVALGAADQISVLIRHVLVQTRTPDHLRGRVSAVNSMFIECSNELGGFESGVVARVFTPVISVVSGGIGTLLVVAGVAIGIPQLRRLGDVHERVPGDAKSAE